jgi:hypothetical protein
MKDLFYGVMVIIVLIVVMKIVAPEKFTTTKKEIRALLLNDSIKSAGYDNNMIFVWDENSHPKEQLFEYSLIEVDSIRNDSVFIHIQ